MGGRSTKNWKFVLNTAHDLTIACTMSIYWNISLIASFGKLVDAMPYMKNLLLEFKAGMILCDKTGMIL